MGPPPKKKEVARNPQIYWNLQRKKKHRRRNLLSSQYRAPESLRLQACPRRALNVAVAAWKVRTADCYHFPVIGEIFRGVAFKLVTLPPDMAPARRDRLSSPGVFMSRSDGSHFRGDPGGLIRGRPQPERRELDHNPKRLLVLNPPGYASTSGFGPHLMGGFLFVALESQEGSSQPPGS